MATEIYKVTKNFPKSEIYGITSQIRRSTISISSNISEGAGRAVNKEFRHFLNISCGSSFELETQLIIGYLTTAEFDLLNATLMKIQKMIYKLIKSIEL